MPNTRDGVAPPRPVQCLGWTPPRKQNTREYDARTSSRSGEHDPVSIIAAIRTALVLRPPPRRVHHR